jgi:proteasome accessory factor C
MGKFSTPTLAQTSRLLDLVPFISTHQNISIAQLSEKFGISKKELLDDLNTLWMCGLPGYTPLELIDLTFDEGYVSIRNAEILEVPRLLSTEEIIVLILGLDLISASTEQLSAEIKSLQNKLREITGDIAKVLPTVNSAHRAILERAIIERKNVTLKYFSPVADQMSTRSAAPLEFKTEAGNEYIVAMTQGGLRIFKLDRISEVEIVDLQSTDERTATKVGENQLSVRVRLLNNLRASAERFNIDPEMVPIDSKESIQVTGFSNDWFIRSTLAAAGDIEILEPGEIRQELANRSRALLAHYTGATLPD